MRTIVEKTFLAEPFDVVTVPSGEAAIQQAKQIRPSVVIVDAGMAGVSGYDVCRAVRDDTIIGQIPLVIMSGVSSLYDESRGESAGVTEHVKKPFDTSQLIELVCELAASAPEIEEVPEEEISSLSKPAEPIASLESLSEPPLESLEELSEASGSLMPEVEIEDDVEEPVLEIADELPQVEEPAHQARTSTQEFGRPAFLKEAAPSTIEMVEEQPHESDESEFGEVALGVETESMPAEDVAPIELGTPKSDAVSEQFQVGTLAELAQMDAQARPIEPESTDEAIEIASPSMEAESAVSAVSEAPAITQPSVPPVVSAVESKYADSRVEEVVKDRVDDAAKDVAAGIEGITVEQADAIQTLTREVIERVVWEVVPDLAEVIIKEELARLLEE